MRRVVMVSRAIITRPAEAAELLFLPLEKSAYRLPIIFHSCVDF
jgi:hypothetical protein